MTADDASKATRAAWAVMVSPATLDAAVETIGGEVERAAAKGLLGVANPHRCLYGRVSDATVEAAYQRLRDSGFRVTRWPGGAWLVEW